MFCFNRWLAFLTHDIVKYLLAAGGLYVLIYGVLAVRLAARRLQPARVSFRQMVREVGWSLVSAVIFGTASLFLVIGPGQLGWNRMYFDFEAWTWGYELFSLVLMIVAHDAYFYWTHRLLHHPVLMRHVHRAHHHSRAPTPWTAYAFDPAEAVVQVAFPPLFATLVPLHPLILFSRHKVRVLARSADDLPLDDQSVDTIVVTWSLCSIVDVGWALMEARRVLRPGGQMRFVEHGLSPDRNVATWQDRLTPLWRCCAGGCHLNRKMDDLIRGGGFQVAELCTAYARGPRPMVYMYEGSAV